MNIILWQKMAGTIFFVPSSYHIKLLSIFYKMFPFSHHFPYFNRISSFSFKFPKKKVPAKYVYYTHPIYKILMSLIILYKTRECTLGNLKWYWSKINTTKNCIFFTRILCTIEAKKLKKHNFYFNDTVKSDWKLNFPQFQV